MDGDHLVLSVSGHHEGLKVCTGTPGDLDDSDSSACEELSASKTRIGFSESTDLYHINLLFTSDDRTTIACRTERDNGSLFRSTSAFVNFTEEALEEYGHSGDKNSLTDPNKNITMRGTLALLNL